MTKYLKYIFFDEFSNQKEVEMEDRNHFTEMHPGPMTNAEDLCDLESAKNLFGSGMIKGLEHEYIDRYILDEKNIDQDYVVMNGPLFLFLKTQYGGSMIKRFHVNQEFNSEPVEHKLKQLRVKFIDLTSLCDG